MTLQELRDVLDELIERGQDPESRVLIVHQPGYPIQEDIRGVATAQGCDEARCEDGKDDNKDDSGDAPALVYVVAGGQPRDISPYGPRRAWEACGR